MAHIRTTVRMFNQLLRFNFHSASRRLLIMPLPTSYASKALSSESAKQPKLSISEIVGTELSAGEGPEMRKEREASWKTMRFSMISFTLSVIGLGGFLIFEFGKPSVNERGEEVEDEYSNRSTLMQYLLRCIRELNYYTNLLKEPSRDKLLPDELNYPYIQPKYTLVLELTDVLVHPEWTYYTGWRFKKRPGIDHFLETLSGIYEIVVYTAEQGMTVFSIMEYLDPKNLIMYKLVRDATHFVDGHHVKNLDKLNRDLKRVVVVDWNAESVKLHPENMFHIPRWKGNDDDTTLIDLTAFLQTIANSEVEDVRNVLNYYNNFENGLVVFREKQRKLLEQQEELENKPKDPSLLPKAPWPEGLTKSKSFI